MVDAATVGPQRADKIGDEREGVVEGLHVGNLRADVHVDAGDLEAGKGAGAGIDFAGARNRHAEFVLGLAGRNLGVGFRVDVGIDANGDGRDEAQRRRDLGKRFAAPAPIRR